MIRLIKPLKDISSKQEKEGEEFLGKPFQTEFSELDETDAQKIAEIIINDDAEEESDEADDEWEYEQLKNAGVRNAASLILQKKQLVEPPLIQQKSQNFTSQEHEEATPAITSIQMLDTLNNAVSMSKETVVNEKSMLERKENELSSLREENRNHKANLSGLQEKLTFLTETQSYIDALVDFLDEKVPMIEECEEMWFDIERKNGRVIDQWMSEESAMLWKDTKKRLEEERRMEKEPLSLSSLKQNNSDFSKPDAFRKDSQVKESKHSTFLQSAALKFVPTSLLTSDRTKPTQQKSSPESNTPVTSSSSLSEASSSFSPISSKSNEELANGVPSQLNNSSSTAFSNAFSSSLFSNKQKPIVIDEEGENTNNRKDGNEVEEDGDDDVMIDEYPSGLGFSSRNSQKKPTDKKIEAKRMAFTQSFVKGSTMFAPPLELSSSDSHSSSLQSASPSSSSSSSSSSNTQLSSSSASSFSFQTPSNISTDLSAFVDEIRTKRKEQLLSPEKSVIPHLSKIIEKITSSSSSSSQSLSSCNPSFLQHIPVYLAATPRFSTNTEEQAFSSLASTLKLKDNTSLQSNSQSFIRPSFTLSEAMSFQEAYELLERLRKRAGEVERDLFESAGKEEEEEEEEEEENAEKEKQRRRDRNDVDEGKERNDRMDMERNDDDDDSMTNKLEKAEDVWSEQLLLSKQEEKKDSRTDIFDSDKQSRNKYGNVKFDKADNRKEDKISDEDDEALSFLNGKSTSFESSSTPSPMSSKHLHSSPSFLLLSTTATISSALHYHSLLRQSLSALSSFLSSHIFRDAKEEFSSLSSLSLRFAHFLCKYPDEYISLNVVDELSVLMAPFVRKELCEKRWNVLSQPRFGMELEWMAQLAEGEEGDVVRKFEEKKKEKGERRKEKRKESRKAIEIGAEDEDEDGDSSDVQELSSDEMKNGKKKSKNHDQKKRERDLDVNEISSEEEEEDENEKEEESGDDAKDNKASGSLPNSLLSISPSSLISLYQNHILLPVAAEMLKSYFNPLVPLHRENYVLFCEEVCVFFGWELNEVDQKNEKTGKISRESETSGSENKMIDDSDVETIKPEDSIETKGEGERIEDKIGISENGWLGEVIPWDIIAESEEMGAVRDAIEERLIKMTEQLVKNVELVCDGFIGGEMKKDVERRMKKEKDDDAKGEMMCWELHLLDLLLQSEKGNEQNLLQKKDDKKCECEMCRLLDEKRDELADWMRKDEDEMKRDLDRGINESAKEKDAMEIDDFSAKCKDLLLKRAKKRFLVLKEVLTQQLSELWTFLEYAECVAPMLKTHIFSSMLVSVIRDSISQRILPFIAILEKKVPAISLHIKVIREVLNSEELDLFHSRLEER
ncbi:uncharacterized protein MONOS_675 [Monocercomonoides exilis]|uniref:uncharacterized protein n=1 Tax=Monocercomonoides exilis TaxID=2049356 RepID=UPI00355A5B80|nr:hypothetical protein MONOS_675 [Monocercomonoides exilis]|eukprot:MONOS_675.1-p1 / transcript=MONOS_675.1 / gene=MONOS_675 / organism=Monocercomonoides_exilis_PA203 / gene_product=unspecified product / transcript_product=unspecified product / location=Mono_scaffold00011:123029-127424(-) / protein_length=1356 / sequence_SO=supercontig / SO=protein_coding / is_pseudo=false